MQRVSGRSSLAARRTLYTVVCAFRVLGALCHVSGWLVPMYGAAVLETKNVKEYDDAASHARVCDRTDLVPCLQHMAEVELEHERYFKQQVRSHWLGRWLPLPRCTRGAEAAVRRDAS